MQDIGREPRCWRLRRGEFDERRGELRAEEGAVELDRSSRAILSLLLHNIGEPVDKARLLDAGWPAIIVHENSLAKAISRLREALGRDGGTLKAVYGIGYMLDPAILESTAHATGEPAARGTPFPVPRRHAPAVLRLAGAVLLIALAFALGHYWPLASAGGQISRPPVIEDASDSIGKLLWVDDHPENNISEKRFFEGHRIAVHPVTNSADALRLLQMYNYKVVISDLGRGEDRLAGTRFVQQMRSRHDSTPVIIYTVGADSPAKQQAQKQLVAESGAQALAVKSEQIREIVLHLFGDPPERKLG